MTATYTYTDEQLKSAVDSINYWYNLICSEDEALSNEAGEKYESLLEYYSKKFRVREAWLEDLATDTRYLGWDCC